MKGNKSSTKKLFSKSLELLKKQKFCSSKISIADVKYSVCFGTKNPSTEYLSAHFSSGLPESLAHGIGRGTRVPFSQLSQVCADTAVFEVQLSFH